jgi:hypothetical protein
VGLSFEILTEGPVSHHHEDRLRQPGVQACRHVQKHGVVFFGPQSGDDADDRVGRTNTEFLA